MEIQRRGDGSLEFMQSGYMFLMTPRLLLRALTFNGVTERTDQQVAIELPLHKKILRAHLDRCDSGFFVIEPGHHDYRDSRRLGVRSSDGFETMAIGQG